MTSTVEVTYHTPATQLDEISQGIPAPPIEIEVSNFWAKRILSRVSKPTRTPAIANNSVHNKERYRNKHTLFVHNVYQEVKRKRPRVKDGGFAKAFKPGKDESSTSNTGQKITPTLDTSDVEEAATAVGPSGSLPIAIRMAKRERLRSLTFTSTLNLLGDDTITFEDEHWRILSRFMDAWERNNSVWFYDLPTRNLSTTLVMVRTEALEEAQDKEPYICIRGLLEEKEIVAFHAVLAQNNVRLYYSPLRICFDRSRIHQASDKQLFVKPGSPDLTLCGSAASTTISGMTHYLTVGGVLDINGSMHLITANHESPCENAETPRSVSKIISEAEDWILEKRVLVVDSWADDAIFHERKTNPLRMVVRDTHFEDMGDVISLDESGLGGQHWQSYVLASPRCRLPNAFIFPPNDEVVASIDPGSPNIRFVSGFSTNREEFSGVRKDVIVLAARTGICSGVLAQNISFIAIQSIKWTRVWTVRINGNRIFQKGDSGAWVIDKADDSLLGHVIAVSNSVAYVIPIEHTLKEIRQNLTPDSEILMSSPFQCLAELAHHIYNTSPEDPDIRRQATSIARKAISEEALRVRPPLPYSRVLENILRSQEDYDIFSQVICSAGAKWQSMLQTQHWGVTSEREMDFATAILYQNFKMGIFVIVDHSRATINDAIEPFPDRDEAGLEEGSNPFPDVVRRPQADNASASSQSLPVKELPETESFGHPDDPQNWNDWLKTLHMLTLMVLTSVTNFSFTILSGIPTQMSDRLRVDNAPVITLVIMIYYLGSLCPVVLLIPLHNICGRRFILAVHVLLFSLSNVLCAISEDLAKLLIFRFIMGCASAIPQRLVYIMIKDLFDDSSMTSWNLLWSFSAGVGASAGLVSGSFIASALGWPWLFWIPTIATGAAGTFAIFLPESSAPIFTTGKIKGLRWSSLILISARTLRPRIRMLPSFLKRLFVEQKKQLKGASRILLFYGRTPKLLALSFWLGCIQGSLHLYYTTFVFVLKERYQLSSSNVGLAVIGFIIGNALAAFILMIYHAAFRGAQHIRLTLLSILATVFVFSGLIVYSWTSENSIHLVVPQIGLALLPLGWIAAAGGDAPYQTLARSTPPAPQALLAFGLPFCGIPLYRSIGVGWGNTVLAFIILLAGMAASRIHYNAKTLSTPYAWIMGIH